MDIQSHKRTLSIIHIVLGLLKFLFIIGMLIFFSSLFPIIESEILEQNGEEAVFISGIVWSAVYSIMIIIAVLVCIPSVVGGFATLRNKNWGMVLLLISGCISLLSFPIGTTVGIYTIWVFVQNNRELKEQKDKALEA